MERNIYGQMTYKEEADRAFPEGCACGNNGGGEAWRSMPLNNIKQARAAEIQRIIALGIDLQSASRSAARDCNVVVSVRDPKGTKEPKFKTWYNVKTDVEWGWRDVAHHRDPAEYIWAQNCTSASNHNAVRAYQRKKVLGL